MCVDAGYVTKTVVNPYSITSQQYKVRRLVIFGSKTVMSPVKVLFGTYFFGSLPKEASQEFLSILKTYNVRDLDTAYQYVSLPLDGVDVC